MPLNSAKRSLLAACCIGTLVALAPASAQTANSPIRVLEKESVRVKTVDELVERLRNDAKVI